MRTTTPHRAHVNTRASAAATARASRGLYKSGRARDPLSGYPVLSRHRGRLTRRPGMSPRASTLSTPALLATPSRAEAIASASAPAGRWVTSHEHTPGVSRERLSSRGQAPTLTRAGERCPMAGAPSFGSCRSAVTPSSTRAARRAKVHLYANSHPGSEKRAGGSRSHHGQPPRPRPSLATPAAQGRAGAERRVPGPRPRITAHNRRKAGHGRKRASPRRGESEASRGGVSRGIGPSGSVGMARKNTRFDDTQRGPLPGPGPLKCGA